MGSEIINRRRSVLLPAVMDMAIYDSLCETTKDAVEEVNAKPPANTTADDILTLANAIAEAAST